jgi:hypothetical protein
MLQGIEFRFSLLRAEAYQKIIRERRPKGLDIEPLKNQIQYAHLKLRVIESRILGIVETLIDHGNLMVFFAGKPNVVAVIF